MLKIQRGLLYFSILSSLEHDGSFGIHSKLSGLFVNYYLFITISSLKKRREKLKGISRFLNYSELSILPEKFMFARVYEMPPSVCIYSGVFFC